jgi:hypothetical protein
MTTDRDRFLVWFLESVEVRKGTVRQLTFGDLKPLNDKEVPFWLRVEARRLKGKGKDKYKKAKHIGFLHYYVVQKFEAYKQELKQKGIIFNDDSPLFMSYKTTPQGTKGDGLTNISAIFTDASEKAWKDLTKKRFSAHDFRDIIPTILRDKLKISGNLVKPLSSHAPQGIEAVYEGSDETDKPNEDLLKVFKSCIPFLVPETIPELKIELNQQKAETEKEKLENSKVIDAMKEEHKKETEAQNKKIEELEDHFEEKLAETMRKAIDFINQAKKQVTEDERYSRDGYDR